MINKISLFTMLAILNGTAFISGSIFFDLMLRSRVLNQKCANDLDCSKMGFAACNADHDCECLDHFFTVNGSQCLPLVQGFCDDNKDCLIKDTTCVENKCQCKPGYALQSYHCLPSTLKSYCKSDYDCLFTYYTECKNYTCVCKENYMLVDSTCLPLLGSYCVDNGPCAAPNSVCVQNKCQCRDNFFAETNYECKLNLLGKECSYDNDCAGIKLAECSENKTCTCRTQKISHNRRVCLQVLGEGCSSNGDCAPKNSMCVAGKCRCKPNFVAISDYECFEELIMKTFADEN